MYTLRNKVQLIGHLGKNPEIKNTQNGKKLVRFTMATNEVYKDANGEKVNETQWHNIVAFGKVADIAEQYLSKGSEIAVEGKLTYYDYLDNAGQKKSVTEVNVSELMLLDKKSK